MTATSRIDEIIEQYQGGNEDLSWDDMDYLHEHELFDELANSIVYCNGCGWWCEAHEMNESKMSGDGDICNDCKDEEEENG